MASLSVTWISPPLARPRLGAAAWLALAGFATVTQALMVPGLLPGLAEDLGVGVAQAGQATTAFALAAGLGALPIARLAARVPGRLVVLGGLAGLAVVNLMTALVPSLAPLLALRSAAGLLAAAVLPAAPALATELVAASVRVRALAAVTFGTTLAFALGLPAATLAAAAFGWQAAFLLASALCAGAALLLARRLPAGGPSPAGSGQDQGVFPIMLRRAIAVTLLLVLLAFASVFATQAFLGPIAAVTLGASPALLQAMIAVGALAGVPVGAALAERFAERAPALIASCLLLAALWQWGVLAGELHSPLLQAGQTMFASAALFAVSPVLQARLVSAAGEARRLVLAANFVAVCLGQAAGAGLGGLALDAGGLAGAAAGGVLAAAAMLGVAARPSQGRTARVS